MTDKPPVLSDPTPPPKPDDTHPGRRFYRPLVTPLRKPEGEDAELPNVAPAAAYLKPGTLDRSYWQDWE